MDLNSVTNENKRTGKKLFQAGNKAAVGRGPSHVSIKAKESIINFIEANVDKVQESFDLLSPRDKLKFVSEIMAYAVPKLQSITTDVNVTTVQSITPIIQIYKSDVPTGRADESI